MIEALSQAVSSSHSQDTSLPGAGCVQRGYNTLEERFDSTHGGFGREPKFPQPSENKTMIVIFITLPILKVTWCMLGMQNFSANSLKSCHSKLFW